MNYKKSLQKLEEGLENLDRLNNTVPIIVEGEKDIIALNALGINGKIIPLNSGISISNLCDTIAKRWKEIIILTDWDRQGGRLCKRLIDNLKGRTHCNTDFRKIFAKNACVKDMEGLPKYIKTLKQKIYYLF